MIDKCGCDRRLQRALYLQSASRPARCGALFEGRRQTARPRTSDSNTCHAGPPTRVSALLCRNPRTMERVNIELRFPADDPALTATVRHDAQR